MKSMTGFGRSRSVINDKEYLIEIRALNNRYCELNTKLPKSCTYLEEKLKTFVKSKVNRGKVEIFLAITDLREKETSVTVNVSVVRKYLEELRGCSQELGLSDNLALSDIFRMADAFTVLRCEIDENEVMNNVLYVCSNALDEFCEMREKEGDRLKADILEKLSNIEKMTIEAEKLSPEASENYRNRLTEKLNEVLKTAGVTADYQRILTEAAIFAEKTAIDEETVRLHSHFKQFREMTQATEPIGRKLDFLVQELNREINTIGSKCQDLRVTRLVIDMKSEIEKIREQIQNIE